MAQGGQRLRTHRATSTAAGTGQLWVYGRGQLGGDSRHPKTGGKSPWVLALLSDSGCRLPVGCFASVAVLLIDCMPAAFQPHAREAVKGGQAQHHHQSSRHLLPGWPQHVVCLVGDSAVVALVHLVRGAIVFNS